MKLLQKLDDLRTEANLRTTLSKEQFNELGREQIGPREARYFAALHNAYPALKARIEELEKWQKDALPFLQIELADSHLRAETISALTGKPTGIARLGKTNASLLEALIEQARQPEQPK